MQGQALRVDVFGFSALSVRETSSGSLEIRQRLSVPLEAAFTASSPYFAIPELDWHCTASSPMLAIDQSWASVTEALERIADLDALELMTAAQSLSSSRELNQATSELGFSPQELIVPYSKQGQTRDKWLLVVDKLLKREQHLHKTLTRLRWISDKQSALHWIKASCRLIAPHISVPYAQPHQLDLLSPDLTRRVILGHREPFRGLLVDKRPRLFEFVSFKEMVEWATETLDRPPGDPSMISTGLRKVWDGEPLATQLVRPYASRDLILRPGQIMKPSQGQRGYLKSKGERQDLKHLAPHTLPSGMINPALPALKSRVIPRGTSCLYNPMGVWQ